MHLTGRKRKNGMMKCETALLEIDAYINGELNQRELEKFIEHVKSCPSCYDELETHYTISEGIRYLEEDRTEAYNIPKMLKKDLEKKERMIRRHHRLNAVFFAGGELLLLGLIFGLLVYFGIIDLPIF